MFSGKKRTITKKTLSFPKCFMSAARKERQNYVAFDEDHVSSQTRSEQNIRHYISRYNVAFELLALLLQIRKPWVLFSARRQVTKHLLCVDARKSDPVTSYLVPSVYTNEIMSEFVTNTGIPMSFSTSVNLCSVTAND
jgi:hypothetical protein